MSAMNDINSPILVIIKKGRQGRGWLVSTIENPTDPFPCSSAEEIGKAVLELLDDPNQPRFDETQIFEDAPKSKSNPLLEEEDEDEEDYGDYPAAGGDIADQIIFEGLSRLFSGARSISNKKAPRNIRKIKK